MKFVLLLLVVFGINFNSFTRSNFDKEIFYSVLSSNQLEKIENQLNILQKSSFPEKSAYEGVLLMRKAGLISKPIKRLNLFKQGAKQLEASINADLNNHEFRFLRLMIQENAPHILGYHSDIENDKLLIKKHFKSLNPIVQHYILNYSKSSKVLHTEDF